MEVGTSGLKTLCHRPCKQSMGGFRGFEGLGLLWVDVSVRLEGLGLKGLKK